MRSSRPSLTRLPVAHLLETVGRSSGLLLALLLSVGAFACSDGSGGDDEAAEGNDPEGNDPEGYDLEGNNPEDNDPEGSAPTFSESGVCGVRATGVVTPEDFQIKEERYLLGDGGFGTDICVVSFDVRRVGDAPPGCDENAGQQSECLWTHLVQYDNPTVVLDENGVCANSELGMDADAIAAFDGLQVAYGYVFEYVGHNSVLMVYDDERETWGPGGNAGWDEMTGDLLFDERRGFCNYAPGPAVP